MSQNPTNADILREVQSIHEVLKDHENRIKAVETYKTSQEAVANYVAKYGTREQKEGAVASQKNNVEFAKILAKLLGIFSAIIALIYLIVQEVAKRGST